MSVLIKDVLLDGEETSIYVEENTIRGIGSDAEADRTVDGRGKAAIPGMVNTHTHAAMTLFRGYADDLRLQEWLQEHIWPAEAKLTEEDVYWGTRLACLEMVKTGTTCFNDMYWHLKGAVKAVEDSGIRGVLNSVFIDKFNKEDAKKQRKQAEKEMKDVKACSRVTLALGPHAIYTVTEESLQWAREYSDKHDVLVHFHLSETAKEVEDCKEETGMRPVEYLDSIGFLGPNLVCAHCVWLDDREIRLMGESGVKVSHCPTSNMKLSVGEALDYEKLKHAGVCVSLGTDGCASNNTLDMFESMKNAALLQKIWYGDPTRLPAGEAFRMGTSEGAKALKLDTGAIEEGRLADIVLVDLKRPELTPHHNLVSDLVYSASGGCVDTVICDGEVIMENGRVDGEEEVMEKAEEIVGDLFSR
ncbi:MAG: amidohydrolase family protein [Candidatus Altiarchaeales archaeon]|nr:amidohydrolase family protein [Candidatus Altiarchaeales archaeon]MBD3416280.1 amidohydrolase family protein [Candidatus Altiarchaeales archaeon]